MPAQEFNLGNVLFMIRAPKVTLILILFFVFFLGGGLWWVLLIKRSPFLNRCNERLEQENYVKNAESKLCEQLRTKFFQGWGPIQQISPQTVEAPPLPIDSKVRFIAFYNPDYLAAFAYCYFVFRGWFDPEKISPDKLALSASGFTIMKDELVGYDSWLNSHSGEGCRFRLKDETGLAPMDLAKEIGAAIAVIAINPVGAIRSDGGMQPLLREARLTMNHERIHAIHVNCPSVDKAASEHWTSLDVKARDALKVGHLDYDWNNPKIAIREAFAYAFEDNPAKVLEYTGNCFAAEASKQQR